ncbi:DUF2842 domain-containing protein [Sneathiella aquimaris]|uniref:DUF2842 domain-containing protein n=1 Tax=Sneathiella aquimaris TaxID=2599305 RepID=UPI00146BFCE2|nr:DUF2842 domain-containing protein [Sneathiella aquimaris]
MNGRKLAGLMLLLLLVVVYSFAGMLMAIHLLPDSKWAELIYYPVIGIMWIFPAMKIIAWMQPKDPE